MDYLLKKRYTNLKSKNKKPGKAASNPVVETPQDADSLHKELLKELQKGQMKKDINWAVLKNLQKLSFSSRRHSIEELSGSKVVNQILEKYPFLYNERIVSDIFFVIHSLLSIKRICMVSRVPVM